MNKINWFLCGIFVVLLLGAGYKFSLSEYEEECLEYKQVPFNITWKFCDTTNIWCYTCKPNCYNYTTTYHNQTKECIKYHLVRNVR